MKRNYTKPKFNSGWFNGHQKSGSENPYWKGDRATVSSLHCWIRDNFKSEPACEICGRLNDGGAWFDWSNKDHKYTRERRDWQHVCRSCHINFDKKYNNRKWWGLNGKWSKKYDACIDCGRNKVKHKYGGRCSNCALKYKNERRKVVESF